MRQFFVTYPLTTQPMVGSYDFVLLSISILIAIASSFTAFALAKRYLHSANSISWSNNLLLSSAINLGSGIWSMHFVGMLAFELPMPMGFHMGLTVISLLIAIIACYLAFMTLAKGLITNLKIVIAGIILALGIASMHYLGMEAMQMGNFLQYDSLGFAVSILVGVLASILALYLVVHLSAGGFNHPLGLQIIASIVMGGSISGIHYTAMAASVFLPISANAATVLQQGGNLDTHSLGTIITLISFSFFAFSLMSLVQFGTTLYRNLGLWLLGVFLFFIVVLSNYTLNYNKQQTLVSVKQSLESVLKTTEEALTIWLFNQKQNMKQLGKSETLISATASLLAKKNHLAEQKNIQMISKFLSQRWGENKEAAEYYLISLEYKNIASHNIKQLGKINQILQTHAGLLIQAFQGETVFVPPMLWESEDHGLVSSKTPSLFIITPIINQKGIVVAVLAKQMNPAKAFSRVIQLGRIGQSGESYALNQTGLLLSESRFDQQLRGIGMIAESERAILSIEIRDPGINLLEQTKPFQKNPSLPLTQMAAHATQKKSGSNIEGYRDYRGVPVYGAWVWNDFLGLGLATEIDVQEALNPYYALRLTLVGALGVVVLCASFGIIFTLIYGEKASKLMMAAQADLEDLVDERTKELKESEQKLILSLDKANSATKAKSSFLANMSHEIRTPMNAIIGFTDILKETELNVQQSKYINTVNRSAKSLLILLNDILDGAKLEEGKLNLEAVPFNIKILSEDIQSSLMFKARENAIFLKLKFADGLSDCFTGDPTRLRQVLINLLGNSIKFTHEGGVTLEIVPDTKPDYLHFKVIDTGIGIPADRIEHIFEPFSQADSSTTRKYGGTGLGTTISRQLVGLMEGKIWIESEVGKGSIFHFTAHLPETICIDEVIEERVLGKADVSMKILLAEDVLENVELATYRLENAGHEVICAEDGLKAVELFESQSPDLILMDIQMPNLDGLDATRRIREIEEAVGGHIPIVALSASILEDDKIQCFEVGMDGFVSKPIDFHTLFAEIAKFNPTIDNNSETFTPVLEPKYNLGVLPELDGIDFEKGLVKWQDIDLYTHNLINFAKNHSHDFQDLKDAIEQQEYQTAHQLSHSLKGVAGNLSIVEVCNLASDLNDDIKDQTGSYESKVKLLGEAIDIAFTSIASLSEKEEGANLENKLSEPEVFAILQQLLTDLDLDNPGAALPQVKILKPYLTTLDWQLLYDQIDGFSFREAEATLQNIIANFKNS